MVQVFLQDPVASLRSWGQAPAPGLNNIDPINQTNITAGSIFTGVNSIGSTSSPEPDPNNQSELVGSIFTRVNVIRTTSSTEPGNSNILNYLNFPLNS